MRDVFSTQPPWGTAPAAKPEDQARLRQMLSQAMSNAEAMAYVESLRQRFKVVQRPITGGEDSQQ